MQRDDRQSRVIFAHNVGLGWGFLRSRVRILKVPAFQTAWQADLGFERYALTTTRAEVVFFQPCAPMQRDDRQSRVIFAHNVGLGWGFLRSRVRILKVPAFQTAWQADLGFERYALTTTARQCRLQLLCHPHPRSRFSRDLFAILGGSFEVLRTLLMVATNEVEEGAKATKD